MNGSSSRFIRWAVGQQQQYPILYDTIMSREIPVKEKCISVVREKIEYIENNELTKEFEDAWNQFRGLRNLPKQLPINVRRNTSPGRF